MEDKKEEGASGRCGEEKPKKQKKFFKGLFKFLIILAVLIIAWIAFALIGRLDAEAVIPDTAGGAQNSYAAVVQVSIPNPSRFLDKLFAHEALNDISAVPDLAPFAPVIESLKENKLLKNKFLRLAMGGNLELALLSNDAFAAAYDLKLFSPLLRLLPFASNFVTVPNLYYVKAGKFSRFEYRRANNSSLDDMTVYIGMHKNILFITDNHQIYETHLTPRVNIDKENLNFRNINISKFDAAVRLSHQYINELLSGLDPNMEIILESLEFESTVEAGLLINPKKLEFHLSAPLSSDKSALNRFIQSRSQASDLIEQMPSSTQYATVLSAGTLRELYEAAFLFMPDLDEMISTANSAARFLLGFSVDDLLFSWSGNEYAVFGMEGRPHPVYAIQIADERKRQEVFDKAFSSLFINEDIRLNLDGTRIPRIALPDFLQSILKRWNISLPSPYYIIHKDFLLLSESAEALLAALRAMQRNDVLPRTAIWKSIAQSKSAGSAGDSAAFTVYYSLDRSIPFFLRQNTAFSGYLSLYRQGLVNMGFNRGIINLSFSLIPGSGNGVMLSGGYPIDLAALWTGGIASNQLYGAGSRLFFASGSSAFSMDISQHPASSQDNAIKEISGQGRHWVIPAEGLGEPSVREKGKTFAWVVSDRGRVTLVDEDMEPQPNFPLMTGLRISASPAAFEGRLYLCDDDGFVHIIDEKANQKKWDTSFFNPLISPPSFLATAVRGRNPVKSYAAVYPKSFFGEIYLLDSEGKTLPNWPAPISTGSIRDDEYTASAGLGFGSPLVFAHNNRILVAFVCQTGELIIYDETASAVSPFPMYLNNIFYLQPVFDGTYLWLIAEDGTLFRVSMEGELLYQNIPNFFVRDEGYITLFDMDNDKIPEIFITGEGNALYGYTRNFRSLEGFPLPVWGRPYFTSGKNNEVFGIGMDRKLYRWQFR